MRGGADSGVTIARRQVRGTIPQMFTTHVITLTRGDVYMNRWMLFLLFAALAGCDDPRGAVTEEATDETTDETTDEVQGSTSVISETGGSLSSEDGLFTVEIPPFILSQPIQLTITSGGATGVPSSFSAISQGYSVTMEPSDAIPAEGSAIRISFRFTEDIALANDFNSANIYSQRQTEEGLTPWSLQETSTDVDSLALWSFVENTEQTFSVFVPFVCACDETEACEETCDCDTDCGQEPTDTSDASDPVTHLIPSLANHLSSNVMTLRASHSSDSATDYRIATMVQMN